MTQSRNQLTHGPGNTFHDGSLAITPPKSASPAMRALRAAVYGRKSDANDLAVRGQWDVCRQRAIEDGYGVPDDPSFQFGDDATSGRKTSRSDLDRLLAVVRSGAAPFDRIYVRDIDRLTRVDDPRFLHWFCYECKSHGVLVCFAADAKHVDYDTPSGEATSDLLIKDVRSLQARDELIMLKARVRRGKRSGARGGFHVGFSHPYGTERWLARRSDRAPVEPMPKRGGLKRSDHAVILRWDESRLPAIRFLFERLADGNSVRSVARELNVRRFPPPQEGGRFSPGRVTSIARNPIYFGEYLYLRTVKRDVPVVRVTDRLKFPT